MGYFYTKKSTVIEPSPGPYKHRFGGVPSHRFTGDDATDLNVHCLYELDTSDSALPNLLRGHPTLPLYYPLFNDACDFSYQVVSPSEVKIHLVSNDVQPDFPYEGFPPVLPEHSVNARALSYSEQKTLVYAFTAASELNENAISAKDKQFLKSIGYPCTQIGGIHRMAQGVPSNRCANPDCKDEFPTHYVIAVVWNTPIPDFYLWGEYSASSQIIFQICSKCRTIHACNRCG